MKSTLFVKLNVNRTLRSRFVSTFEWKEREMEDGEMMVIFKMTMPQTIEYGTLANRNECESSDAMHVCVSVMDAHKIYHRNSNQLTHSCALCACV